MNRFRALLAVLAAFLVLGVAPALAQSSGGDEPAVVLETESEEPGEEAWTFRFLVPTLMIGTAVVVAGVVIGYGLRVRGRYRVVQ